MKITKDTTLGELANLLREYPWGTRMRVGANKPGDYTVIMETPYEERTGRFETISHKNTLEEAVNDATSRHAAELLQRSNMFINHAQSPMAICKGCEDCQPDKIYIPIPPQQGDQDG